MPTFARNHFFVSLSLLFGLICTLLCFGKSQAANHNTVWGQSKETRLGAGGMEAERCTWTRTAKRFVRDVSSGRQEWKIAVSGDSRPTMKRMKIECLGGVVESPFLLSDKNYDFRSMPELTASVVRGARTEEQKALAIRELLIGEGFHFHYSPPPADDPIHRLTNSGYGYCGIHAQLFDYLCQAAGLRSRICGHYFGSGHATNEVFYDGQWHFYDTNGEALFRKPDGIIPSFEEIIADPDLIPTGDAYGQTAQGITNARFVRGLYSTEKIQRLERRITERTSYATLDFRLRRGESITWEWQDADFSHYRSGRNGPPVYGKGLIEYKPTAEELIPMSQGLLARENSLVPSSGAFQGILTIPVDTAYPVMEISLLATVKGSADAITARVSGDNGKTWIPLERSASQGKSDWRLVVKDPDGFTQPADKDEYDDRFRTITSGRYGYLLEVQVSPGTGSMPSIGDLTLQTVFRHYPPALPYLKTGRNTLTYLDRDTDGRRVQLTLEWEGKTRNPGLSLDPGDWGWQKPLVLADWNSHASLPKISSGLSGNLHVVYSTGNAGSKRIGHRRCADGNWSSETIISPEYQNATHPVVAEDTSGNVWVAYQTGTLWSQSDVYAVCIDPSGNIGEPVLMNNTDRFHRAYFPSISAKGDAVSVAWEGALQNKGENSALCIEVGWIRTHDGCTWGEPIPIQGKPFANLGLPRIMYDTKGRLHLTGTKGPRYYKSLYPEITDFQWLTPEWNYHSRGASFSEDTSGNVWAVFDAQNSGTTNEIYCRMLPGDASSTHFDNWTNVLRVSEDDKRPSIYPDLASVDADRSAVVWMDYRHGNPEVFAKVFRDGKWSPDLLLSTSAGSKAQKRARKMTPNELLLADPHGIWSGYPYIARSADNSLWAVWADTDGEKGRVIARKLAW